MLERCWLQYTSVAVRFKRQCLQCSADVNGPANWHGTHTGVQPNSRASMLVNKADNVHQPLTLSACSTAGLSDTLPTSSPSAARMVPISAFTSPCRACTAWY